MRLRSYLYLVAAICVWSTWGLAVRWLGKPASVITFYNSLFSMCFQAAGLFLASKREDLNIGREIPALLFLGTCGLINTLSFFYAIKSTTVAVALLTHYTAPVFVAVIAPLILKDRMKRGTMAALCVSIAGLGLVFGRGVGGGTALAAAAAGTLSGLAYALLIIFSRALSPRHNPLKIAFVQGVVTVMALGFFVVPSGDAGLTIAQAGMLALVGLLHSTAALLLYLYGIRDITAQEAGVLGYLEPVFGITLAYLFLGETPHVLALAGGGLILLSGAAVVFNGRKKGAERSS